MVQIVKAKPVPAQRSVGLHGTVTWVDADTVGHRVASDSGTWRAFTLRPQGRKSVRFDRAGRYPYKVDGRNSLPSHFILTASRASFGKEFHLVSQMDLAAGTSVSHTIEDRTKAACRGFGKGFPHDPRDPVNVRGLAVSAFVLLSEFDASRRDKASALWFPLNTLAAHKTFSFDTGNVERSKSCGTTCQESAEFQLRVTARPR